MLQYFRLVPKLLYVALGVVVIGAGAYGMFAYSQAQLKKEIAKNTRLAIELEQAQERENFARKDFKNTREQLSVLQNKLEVAEEYSNDLAKKLQKHDLTRLVILKPGLVERRMNDATEKVFNEFSSISHPNGVRDTE